ncbi:hypothetical protein JS756_01670 [Streptomyces actuosus]|uniref:Helix-turn-helix DNA binding domain protein n=1 Tax=Streptomyces actuosus TaxID=1885 RepID=A0ABS2VIC3_STRAS|nr:hypothetical protein [Streptomyces actuosus]MBN0042841.1 hypothetical protein [Streptomyces actuosus]
MWKPWKRFKGAAQQRPVPLELCDLCGTAFPEAEAVTADVPDSSCAHPAHDGYDGLRRITACGTEHVEVLREEYLRRPFVQEELWAAKIVRAFGSGPPVRGLEELGRRTGLHGPEIRRAIAWHNERLRRIGPGGPEGTAGRRGCGR